MTTINEEASGPLAAQAVEPIEGRYAPTNHARNNWTHSAGHSATLRWLAFGSTVSCAPGIR